MRYCTDTDNFNASSRNDPEVVLIRDGRYCTNGRKSNETFWQHDLILKFCSEADIFNVATRNDHEAALLDGGRFCTNECTSN